MSNEFVKQSEAILQRWLESESESPELQAMKLLCRQVLQDIDHQIAGTTVQRHQYAEQLDAACDAMQGWDAAQSRNGRLNVAGLMRLAMERIRELEKQMQAPALVAVAPAPVAQPVHKIEWWMSGKEYAYKFGPHIQTSENPMVAIGGLMDRCERELGIEFVARDPDFSAAQHAPQA